jgi:hypothetical protein
VSNHNGRAAAGQPDRSDDRRPATLDPGPPHGWTFSKVPRAVTGFPALGDATFRVYVALLGFSRLNSDCFPSNTAIGQAAGGKSPAAVKRALRELEALGLIRRVVERRQVEERTIFIRERIEVFDAPQPAGVGGSKSNHPWVRNDPPPWVRSDPRIRSRCRKRHRE